MIWRCDLVPQYEAYRDEIHEAMERVLLSGKYILASEVAAFEREFADYVGAKHGIGVANGTDGLTLTLLALGIKSGDEVITTPFTAIPTVSAIIDAGATPVFVDVCADTFLMDLDKLAAALTPRTKAIMPVHIFGSVLDVPRLQEIVGPSIPIVEDASQSHGSTIRGRQSGSMGEAGVFSFYPTKNVGAYGDGGMIVTNNAELSSRLKLLRMYGMRDKDHIVINGMNSRLDELQAAILRVKLKYLDAMNRSRNAIANRYRNELRSGLFVHQHIPDEVVSNYHVFVTRFRGDRAAFMRSLEARQIQTNVYYLVPLHLQEANRFLGYQRGDLPVAEELCEVAVSLPLYAELSGDTLSYIIQTINNWNLS
jgi:dTDP-3-amino-2,3,6-trideoxy-4-keto-D-glucose/dTDP-3-amino-3,4,6-trideoxy-alpha-D-glucose/dTDP-2,6-dideoxy-D-kanosamine transaminase